jgi:hypothetical protein
MNRLKISNAKDSKERSAQSLSQFDGKCGRISGTNSPLSGARPWKTASSRVY